MPWELPMGLSCSGFSSCLERKDLLHTLPPRHEWIQPSCQGEEVCSLFWEIWVMLALVIAVCEGSKSSYRNHHPLKAFCKVTELPLMA